MNAKSNDGRTALGGAKNLKYTSVVQFLIANGAQPGTGAAIEPARRRAKEN